MILKNWGQREGDNKNTTCERPKLGRKRGKQKRIPSINSLAAFTMASISRVVMSPLHIPTFHLLLDFGTSFHFVICLSEYSCLTAGQSIIKRKEGG